MFKSSQPSTACDMTEVSLWDAMSTLFALNLVPANIYCPASSSIYAARSWKALSHQMGWPLSDMKIHILPDDLLTSRDSWAISDSTGERVIWSKGA